MIGECKAVCNSPHAPHTLGTDTTGSSSPASQPPTAKVRQTLVLEMARRQNHHQMRRLLVSVGCRKRSAPPPAHRRRHWREPGTRSPRELGQIRMARRSRRASRRKDWQLACAPVNESVFVSAESAAAEKSGLPNVWKGTAQGAYKSRASAEVGTPTHRRSGTHKSCLLHHASQTIHALNRHSAE